MRARLVEPIVGWCTSNLLQMEYLYSHVGSPATSTNSKIIPGTSSFMMIRCTIETSTGYRILGSRAGLSMEGNHSRPVRESKSTNLFVESDYPGKFLELISEPNVIRTVPGGFNS